ncbi:MAG: hypothetical protein WCH86_06735 [Kiritimatiellales bacterium]
MRKSEKRNTKIGLTPFLSGVAALAGFGTLQKRCQSYFFSIPILPFAFALSGFSHSSIRVPMIGPEPQICRGESAFGITKEAKRQNSLRLFGRVDFPPAAERIETTNPPRPAATPPKGVSPIFLVFPSYPSHLRYQGSRIQASGFQ